MVPCRPTISPRHFLIYSLLSFVLLLHPKTKNMVLKLVVSFHTFTIPVCIVPSSRGVCPVRTTCIGLPIIIPSSTASNDASPIYPRAIPWARPFMAIIGDFPNPIGPFPIISNSFFVPKCKVMRHSTPSRCA